MVYAVCPFLTFVLCWHPILLRDVKAESKPRQRNFTINKADKALPTFRKATKVIKAAFVNLRGQDRRSGKHVELHWG